MKHILNNLTEEEKNSIREQHTGGMKVMTENFNKLLNSKLGDSKPLVEQKSNTPLQDAFTKFLESIASRPGQPPRGTGWIIDPSLPESNTAMKMNTAKLLGTNWTVKPYTNVKDGQPLIWSLYSSVSGSKVKDVYCVIKNLYGVPYIEFHTSYFNLFEIQGRSFIFENNVDKVIPYLTLIYDRVEKTLGANNKTKTTK